MGVPAVLHAPIITARPFRISSSATAPIRLPAESLERYKLSPGVDSHFSRAPNIFHSNDLQTGKVARPPAGRPRPAYLGRLRYDGTRKLHGERGRPACQIVTEQS